jgi:hypothetical protein
MEPFDLTGQRLVGQSNYSSFYGHAQIGQNHGGGSSSEP